MPGAAEAMTLAAKGQCVRGPADDGAEFEIDGHCAWAVCVDASKLEAGCNAPDGIHANRAELLTEDHFTWLNRKENFDYGFSDPWPMDLICKPSRAVGGQCCFILQVYEGCHASEGQQE